MKLTLQQKQKARTIASSNNLPIKQAIALVRRRLTRLSIRPTYVGSAKRAEGYYIL
jgi:hypothetical protein